MGADTKKALKNMKKQKAKSDQNKRANANLKAWGKKLKDSGKLAVRYAKDVVRGETNNPRASVKKLPVTTVTRAKQRIREQKKKKKGGK